MRLGLTIDKGSPDCKHQSLASVCGFEYCLHCSYKFIGHCASCEARKKALIAFFGKKKAEEYDS